MGFDDLLRENYRPLERFVKFRIGNREDAEDVIQEICLAAFQSFGSLKESGNFKTWLIGIARHKCNDYYRSKAKSAEVSFDNIDGETVSMSIYGITEQSAVSETIDALEEKYGQILHMYYLMDMPQAEIAKRLGIPLGTVKSRLHNAKLKFKESYPYQMQQKGESFMKSLPTIMPEYSIVRSDKEPFEAVCKELPGWLIIPRIGEQILFGNYEAPSGKLLDLHELKVENEAEIHGISGVRISCLMKGVAPSDLCGNQSTTGYNMDLFAQLTDDRCRFLAQGQTDDGVYRLRTFLDGDGFCDDWGFGEDNCGRETHLKKKSEIVRDGSMITCEKKQYPVEDVVGRYTVTVGKNKYDTICLFCVHPSDSKIVTEQYIDKDGKTVLWRRFNRNDWGFGRYGKLWTELCPGNECLTVNGDIYVHWYDTLATFTLR